MSAELRGEAFLLHILDGSFTPKQVDGHSRRQEALMLLPLQRLKEKNDDVKKSLMRLYDADQIL